MLISYRVQINNLDELEAYLENDTNNYWRVRNGYIFATESSLQALRAHIDRVPRDELRRRVKVGLHSNVGVTDRLDADIR